MCERPAFGGMTHPRCKTRDALDGLTSFFRYEGIVREAIKVLKYHRVTDLATEFVSCIQTDGTYRGVLLPIPLHPSRFRDRGFNQAEVLGKLVASRLHIPIRTDILRRVKKTPPQVEMKDRNDRLRNMRGVFSVTSFWQASLRARPESHGDAGQASMTHTIKGTFFLFDDVFTTGATMRAAGEALKRGGARFVWAVTMAR